MNIMQVESSISTSPAAAVPDLILTAYGMSEVGRRDENQDSIFPNHPSGKEPVSSTFFLVCDGVGGAAMGQEASKIVCALFGQYFEGKQTCSSEDIYTATREAETALSEFVLNNPDAKGMATTLTFVMIHGLCATIAHAGDSRIYYFRTDQILYQTSDHSLVQEMLDQQLITEEAAATHPHRNVISKALMGTERSVQPDIHVVCDVQEGDCFFLCSDGVLESLNTTQLQDIITRPGLSDAMRIQTIRQECIQRSRDNFSAWLVRVGKQTTVSTSIVPVKNTWWQIMRNVMLSPFAPWIIIAIVLIQIGVLMNMDQRQETRPPIPTKPRAMDSFVSPNIKPWLEGEPIPDKDSLPQKIPIN